MARSKQSWLDLIEKGYVGKGPIPLAEFVLSDLIGYRKTSLKRSEDVDNLCNLFDALIEKNHNDWMKS